MSNDMSSSMTQVNTFSEGLKNLFHLNLILILLFIWHWYFARWFEFGLGHSKLMIRFVLRIRLLLFYDSDSGTQNSWFGLSHSEFIIRIIRIRPFGIYDSDSWFAESSRSTIRRSLVNDIKKQYTKNNFRRLKNFEVTRPNPTTHSL